MHSLISLAALGQPSRPARRTKRCVSWLVVCIHATSTFLGEGASGGKSNLIAGANQSSRSRATRSPREKQPFRHLGSGVRSRCPQDCCVGRISSSQFALSVMKWRREPCTDLCTWGLWSCLAIPRESRPLVKVLRVHHFRCRAEFESVGWQDWKRDHGPHTDLILRPRFGAVGPKLHAFLLAQITP